MTVAETLAQIAPGGLWEGRKELFASLREQSCMVRKKAGRDSLYQIIRWVSATAPKQLAKDVKFP